MLIKILSKQIQIKKNEVPKGWSIEAADFINKMIQRKPMNRLGKNGPAEVKAHPWLKDFPWQDLWQKKVVAPFMPPNQDNFDQKNINEDWKDQEDEEFQQNLLSLRRNSIQNQFNGYYYDYQLAAMNINPGLMSQNDLAAYLQTQSQSLNNIQATSSQTVSQGSIAPIKAVRGITNASEMAEYSIQAPLMLQFPKSEAMSPKGARPAIQFAPQTQGSTTVSHPHHHHHRIQSAIHKPSQNNSNLSSLNDTKRALESQSHLDQSSHYLSQGHQRKTSQVGGSSALARLTPQQQQFLSQQLQNLQHQQQQLVQPKVLDPHLEGPQSISYKSKRTGSRTGTASTKNSSLTQHVRPWSSSVSGSTHATGVGYGGQASQAHLGHVAAGPSNLNHSSLLLRKTASQNYNSHHGHSQSHHYPAQSNNHNSSVSHHFSQAVSVPQHHNHSYSLHQPAPSTAATGYRQILNIFLSCYCQQHIFSINVCPIRTDLWPGRTWEGALSTLVWPRTIITAAATNIEEQVRIIEN